ncbi:hypothetical protein LX36DRAFT_284173 [Colletotrichum falcatum]|nr:hypothetical protein LX36DRAFT_284173 [Colletotrichum falcatum]
MLKMVHNATITRAHKRKQTLFPRDQRTTRSNGVVPMPLPPCQSCRQAATCVLNPGFCRTRETTTPSRWLLCRFVHVFLHSWASNPCPPFSLLVFSGSEAFFFLSMRCTFSCPLLSQRKGGRRLWHENSRQKGGGAPRQTNSTWCHVAFPDCQSTPYDYIEFELGFLSEPYRLRRDCNLPPPE